MQSGGDDFLRRLTLDRLSDDSFAGTCHSGAPFRAFGGQVAAQALMAAGTTVTAPDRRVHSLHAYFLRPGDTRQPITYTVEHARDGASFSTRVVRATQGDDEIFLLTASFSIDDPGPVHQFAMPEVDPPEAGRELPLLGWRRRHIVENFAEYDYPEDPLVSLRVLNESDDDLQPVAGRYERTSWIRVTDALPDDPLVHACALTYISDLSMVSTAIAPHRSVRNDLQVASIDHAMWFHERFRADEWLLLIQDTPHAGHGHGIARALFHDRQGALVSSVVQESLMRTKRVNPSKPDYGTVV